MAVLTDEQAERLLFLQGRIAQGAASEKEELEYYTIITGDESEARFYMALNRGELPDEKDGILYKY